MNGTRYTKGQLSSVLEESLFSDFNNTGFHGELWPSTTYCISEFTSSEELYVVQNTPRERHAESLLLEDLKLMEENTFNLGKTVFINYSPCGSCSQLIRDFLEESPLRDIKFVFAQLYDINRQSCRNRCSPEGKCNSPKGDETEKGLLEIKDHLEPFNQGHWKAFKQLLNKYVNQQVIYTREDEDSHLWSDWDHLITSAEDRNPINEFGNLTIGAPQQGYIQGGMGASPFYPPGPPIYFPYPYYRYSLPRTMNTRFPFSGWY